MPCPRCGQNRQQPQVPIPSPGQAPIQRPGTMPRPENRIVNPNDAIRNAIGGLRYIPR